jgi:UDP-2,4-diacetamido-2,4,6-trideoxy-beta-L-altropyranose hydrolase
MTPQAVFRCDASPTIGGGHVMRCLALAEALNESGWHVTFASRQSTVATLPMLASAGYALRRITTDGTEEPGELERLVPEGCDLLVIDNYGWDVANQRASRGWAGRVLVLDDSTGRNHDCDLLLDSAIADGLVYSNRVPVGATILTGPRHAMVGRAFLRQRAAAMARRRGQPVRSVLVSFGATDPFNAAAVALDALADALPEALVTVALSSQARHLETLRQRAGRKVRFALDVADMASLLASADLAIGAAGGMSFERAALGLPSIVAVLADNQRNLGALLISAGAAADAGPLDAGIGGRLRRAIGMLAGNEAIRAAMAESAAALVDGRGPRRVMAAIAGTVTLPDGAIVKLSLVEPEERELILSWQQEVGARRYSRNRQTPTAEEHRRWFDATLANEDRRLMMIRVDGEPVGNLRLDRLAASPDRHEVSIIVRQSERGRGVASAALELARRLAPAAIFDAVIHPRNTASLTVFRKSGYRHVADDLYRSLPTRAPAP